MDDDDRPPYFYILGEDHVPERVHDVVTWGEAFGTMNRRVAFDEVAPGVTVSTVFLAIDHAMGFGPPELFETMVFDNDDDEEMERYATWDEAVAGHQRMVERVRERLRAHESSMDR